MIYRIMVIIIVLVGVALIVYGAGAMLYWWPRT